MNLQGRIEVRMSIENGKIDMAVIAEEHLTMEESALILEAAARGLRSVYAEEIFRKQTT